MHETGKAQFLFPHLILKSVLHKMRQCLSTTKRAWLSQLQRRWAEGLEGSAWCCVHADPAVNLGLCRSPRLVSAALSGGSELRL